MPEGSIFGDLFDDGDGDLFDIAGSENLFDEDGLPSGGGDETPTYVSGASLLVTDNTISGSVGDWESYGNGTITYEWEVQLTTSVVSGTGASIDESGSYIEGTYELFVRASNDNGYGAGVDNTGYYLVASYTYRHQDSANFVVAADIQVVPTEDSVSIKINSIVFRSGDQQAITTNGKTEDVSEFMNRLMNRFKAYNQN